MATTKYAHARYILINRELRRKRWVKTAEIKARIEEELGLKISGRQIEKDIEAMKTDLFLNYQAPIEYDKQNKAYKYTDRSFSIEKIPLKEEEILALKFYAASLNQYRDYGVFKDFSTALAKVVEAVSIKSSISEKEDSRLIIQTDNNEDIRGVEYLSEIAKAIDKRRKIQLAYKKFEDQEAKIRIFDPYLLKEYKNRWYIIGKLDGADFMTTFALDRVVKLSMLESSFVPDCDFDHQKYFKYSFGITTPDSAPLKVVLLFSPSEANYIKTLKIHSTQQIISDNKHGLKISIEVYPCYELHEYILSKGSHIRVISPKSLRKEIAAMLAESLKLY